MKLLIYIAAIILLIGCQNPISTGPIKSNVKTETVALDSCIVHENATKDSANVTIKIGIHQHFIVQQIHQTGVTKGWITYTSTKDSTLIFCNNDTLYVAWTDIGCVLKCVGFITGRDTILTK